MARDVSQTADIQRASGALSHSRGSSFINTNTQNLNKELQRVFALFCDMRLDGVDHCLVGVVLAARYSFQCKRSLSIDPWCNLTMFF